ncbi:trans-Golgi network integral membrane protein 1-like [Zerene cesonia]|uniref:trans-Golgi network integral membrane protein 1-like n=1 Tax=Zerene cesonia TaxID=33412 RepID=UPI0018E4E44F|nr:trans-Golgi network integral membrane protein 1-like [Zerene cesonia]
MSSNGIVLVLVSIFYIGLGLPVSNTNHTQVISGIENDVLNLANSCENLFLVEMMKNKMENCKLISKNSTKTDYECKMFYDINNQLCTAFGRSEVDLEGNFNAKMSITQNIETICEDAKKWKPTTVYKQELENLFNKFSLCLQVCNVDGMVSEDSNFFCKYYKWGSEILFRQANAATHSSSVVVPTSYDSKSEVKPVVSETTKNIGSSQKTNIEPQVKEMKQSEQSTKSATRPSPIEPVLLEVSKDISALQKPEVRENNDDKSVPPSSKSESQKPVEEPALKSPPEKENQEKPVIENPKPDVPHDLVDETDNDMENDFGPGEPFSDQENMDEEMNADPKIETQKSKENENINKLPLTSFNVDIGQREMVYPNTIQDTFVEEDDHFFPFFLTTVVLVGLLYVLYHNKSKVTKVILGLIVEGRQSNRRRNSRGHAYKRLDTLEQAMSTSSTAPPSKIIY